MDDRWAAIGIDADGAGGVEAALTPLLAAAGETVYRGGGSVFEWRDPSGAGVLVTTVTVDNLVRCVIPTFTSGSRLRAVAAGFGADPSCRFCEPLMLDVVDDDGHPAYRLVVQLEDSALTRPRIRVGSTLVMALTGFVQEARVWPDEAAYDRDQATASVAFPGRSAVATGGAGADALPHAMVSGVVERTEERENEHTGGIFRWMSVESDAARFDLVADPATLAGVAPGNVVRALCWMVGRAVDGLSEPRRSGRHRRP